jgi:hypothetical protein
MTGPTVEDGPEAIEARVRELAPDGLPALPGGD